MTAPVNCLYKAMVTHKRVRPKRHELRYNVFNLFVDIDELPALGRELRWFSHNRANLFAVYDRDHGSGDGTSIASHARGLARAAPGGNAIGRIFMLCYPRMLGYVFNPLTVYYCFDADGALALMIYEVNNTFGERVSYVIRALPGERQECVKKLYVSPFNKVEGTYHFDASAPGQSLALSIKLITGDGPLVSAFITGERRALTDRALLGVMLAMPLMTFKVIAGIHWEAAKLWIKGLRLKHRPPPPDPVHIAGGEGGDGGTGRQRG